MHISIHRSFRRIAFMHYDTGLFSDLVELLLLDDIQRILVNECTFTSFALHRRFPGVGEEGESLKHLGLVHQVIN